MTVALAARVSSHSVAAPKSRTGLEASFVHIKAAKSSGVNSLIKLLSLEGKKIDTASI